MAANRLEQPKQAEEARPAEQAAAVPVKRGNPWVPLIANIILMPAIAYGLTTFVLLQRLEERLKGRRDPEPAPSESIAA